MESSDGRGPPSKTPIMKPSIENSAIGQIYFAGGPALSPPLSPAIYGDKESAFIITCARLHYSGTYRTVGLTNESTASRQTEGRLSCSIIAFGDRFFVSEFP